ncbi:hypothetical protein M409DRAFT_20062 [Zasmidium cellare ATCC 36951]|uniref:Uncharacterized protein n=1 Tax=Zasmidium cellare ATCC 36951 TaxID=1080233 RepID=A0A6A6CV15_ZASCE|nr:uncharacterized protein M409DRAFT_20062 [Zasmidium cellare ATCC 36951]KAF2169649.1 hypothetical protein M409DRAFT_20062 [Zasmidium cellare ATCC 36951]
MPTQSLVQLQLPCVDTIFLSACQLQSLPQDVQTSNTTATTVVYLEEQDQPSESKGIQASNQVLNGAASKHPWTPVPEQHGDRQDTRNKPDQLYDPPMINSKEGDQQQSSPSETKYHDPFDRPDDNDNDSDSLDSLEQTQLGKDSNVPFITDIHETTPLRTQDNLLPAKSTLTDRIEAIYKNIPSVDGLKTWLWGSQYERLLPVTRTKGMGRRKLEGREYESIALEFEYRQGRGSNNANGKG